MPKSILSECYIVWFLILFPKLCEGANQKKDLQACLEAFEALHRQRQVEIDTGTKPYSEIVDEFFAKADGNRQLIPANLRNPSKHRRAPVDLTESELESPFAIHYLFSESQVKVKSLKRAVEASVSFGEGSGVLVSNKGHVLTNWHVSKRTDFDSETVIWDGKEYSLKGAKILASASKNSDPDLAVVHVPALAGLGKPISIANAKPRDGDLVVSSGFNGYFRKDGNIPEKAITVGTVKKTSETQISTNLESSPGSSGSPVVNKRGELVGLAYYGEQAGFTKRTEVVPLKPVRSMLKSLGLLE